MDMLSVADARKRFSEIVTEAEKTHQRYRVTKNGHRSVVILADDDYEAMRETIEVLADADLMRAEREGRAEIDAGDYLDADQLAAEMRRAGRLK